MAELLLYRGRYSLMTTSLRSIGFAAAVRAVGRGRGRPDDLDDATPTPGRHSLRRPTPGATTTFFGDTGTVVRADRRSARATASGRSAATAAAPTTFRATPTSATSPARSPSASRTARRSSARSWSTRASIATCGRCSSADPDVGGFVDRYPARAPGRGPATTSATSIWARSSTCVGGRPEAGGARRARRW